MKINHLALCCLGIGVLFVTAGFYVVGFLILGLTFLLYGFVAFLVWEIFELYSKFPTVWQDISETLAVAKNSWFLRKKQTPGAVLGLYRVLAMYPEHFEIRVDEKIVTAFEEIHPFLQMLGPGPHTPLTKALSYFMYAFENDSEYFAVIQGSVLVKKRAGGIPNRADEKFITHFSSAFS